MKKSLRPQQAAPVQRQTTATTTSTGVGVFGASGMGGNQFIYPLAGDDAE